jgi:hypothetical protein
MNSPQITVRLHPEEKTSFDNYAAAHGLDCSELAKLLIVRELRLQRLLVLKNRKQIPEFKRQSWGKGIRKPTVTAHFSTQDEVKAFDRYAESCSLNRQKAGAWVLTAELDEQWLEKALSLKVRSHENRPWVRSTPIGSRA